MIIGATPNPARYAYLAAQKLNEKGGDFIPLGTKKGNLFGKTILNINALPRIDDVHTVTLYVGPVNLTGYEDYIISLNPKRIIFNPGSENPELAKRANEAGIEIIFGCTLVMISTGTY